MGHPLSFFMCLPNSILCWNSQLEHLKVVHTKENSSNKAVLLQFALIKEPNYILQGSQSSLPKKYSLTFITKVFQPVIGDTQSN